MAAYIDVKQIKEYVKPDAKTVTLKCGDRSQVIVLVYQKTGFGHKRFFSCPKCAGRVQHLYLVNGNWSCRKCSGVNRYYGIQNSTKGGYEEIAYRMKRYADKQGIKFDFPFDYTVFGCDERTKKDKFRQHLMILQALENMRFQAIFYKTKFKPGVIRLVTSGKHPLLKSVTLLDMKDNVYDWVKGVQVTDAPTTRELLKH